MVKRKGSPLFLSIKGGFDNVNTSTLCGMLRAKGANPYLLSCTRSFLTGRSCRLLFEGSRKVFASFSAGTPQGSRISPLFLVIYVSRLHREIPHGRTLCLVDDLAITASSDFYWHNVQLLSTQYVVLKAKGSQLAVSISVPKTKLIQWRTNRGRDPP